MFVEKTEEIMRTKEENLLKFCHTRWCTINYLA